MKLHELVAAEKSLSIARTVAITHSPRNEPLRDILPYFALERPAALAAYQSVHSSPTRRTLEGADYLVCLTRLPDAWPAPDLPQLPRTRGNASFGWYLFVGLYEQERVSVWPSEDVFSDPWLVALQRAFRVKDLVDEQMRTAGKECTVYQFSRTGLLRDWIGKCVVCAAPSPTYVRRLESFGSEVIDVPDAYERYLAALGGRGTVERRVASALKGIMGA